MRKSLLLLVLLGWLGHALATDTKQRLSHDDYARWNNLSQIELSADGQWLVYVKSPQQGDASLFIHHLITDEVWEVPRGHRPQISPESSFVAFSIQPPENMVRQARLEKRKRDEMPVDSLGVFRFSDKRLTRLPALVSFRLPEKGGQWMAYVIDHARIVDEEAEEEESPEPEPGEDAEEPGSAVAEEKPGKVLYIYNPLDERMISVDRVEEYVISERAELFALLRKQNENDSLEIFQLMVADLQALQTRLIESGEGNMQKLSVSPDGSHLAWLFSADTTEHKTWALHAWEKRTDRKRQLASHDSDYLPVGYGPSLHRNPWFSDDNSRLFWGISPLPEPLPKDTLLDEEKYSLDIWHWQDALLQSQQISELKREREKTYLAVTDLRRGESIVLADADMPDVSTNSDHNARWALGSSAVPYLKEMTWAGASLRDLYRLDLRNGSRERIAERVESRSGISAAGDFMFWFDTEKQHWMVFENSSGSLRNLTAGLDVAFYDEDNDLPRAAQPYGMAGFTSDDRGMLVYDRYDIWLLDTRGREKPRNLTHGYGRENRIRFRLVNTRPDEPFYDLDKPWYLDAFHEENKQNGYYRLQASALERLIWDDAFFFQLQQARNAEDLVWRRSTFAEFGEIYHSDASFNQVRKLTETNPWQQDYYWGSVELVSWRDFDGQRLQGLMYYPEDFDVHKSYPMIVYFYERSSDGIHRHSIPSPSRSTINRPYCTSNGYLVFVPDITYKTGFPGESAYNAIVSGTKAMMARFTFIDEQRIGLQGQSWGGYQIAYLVTRTNMFRAAMAGAPVSNMVSAYGGIRWESGRSRQFQYENTQSRIGGTLWEKPFRYIENSPVFFADKIETPLLMMHNDNDGAVPWYQGIEMFLAMRRLEKPVWMLVYNDEAHNLMRWPNRMDLSVRMYQFFDHYLKDAPAPRWLRDGLPAIEKGRTDAYEF